MSYSKRAKGKERSFRVRSCLWDADDAEDDGDVGLGSSFGGVNLLLSPL